jgi:GPI ethanolamine phosphate transferase 3 subunit O
MHSEEWDILVGHYLGVDHAGHTFSVDSPQMRAKVLQMDSEIKEVRSSVAHLCHLSLRGHRN